MASNNRTFLTTVLAIHVRYTCTAIPLQRPLCTMHVCVDQKKQHGFGLHILRFFACFLAAARARRWTRTRTHTAPMATKRSSSMPSWLEGETSSSPARSAAAALKMLVDTITKLRSDAGAWDPKGEPTVDQLHEQVQQLGTKITLEQVRKADAKARAQYAKAMAEEEERRAEEQARLEAEAAAAEAAAASEVLRPCTCAAQCKVSGAGLIAACVRQAATFWIEAYDSRGRKRGVGGDTFFVAVRGPSRLRARITDSEDGRYLVAWKPWTSGVYSITVSLNGELLPGAPYEVPTVSTLPAPSKCIARGSTLHAAVSRQLNFFEVLFKDKLGQTAHAVDLDLFVEPVPLRSPRHRPPKTEQEEAPTEAERCALAWLSRGCAR